MRPHARKEKGRKKCCILDILFVGMERTHFPFSFSHLFLRRRSPPPQICTTAWPLKVRKSTESCFFVTIMLSGFFTPTFRTIVSAPVGALSRHWFHMSLKTLHPCLDTSYPPKNPKWILAPYPGRPLLFSLPSFSFLSFAHYLLLFLFPGGGSK